MLLSSTKLFGVGEGEVGAEADHAEAGGGALSAAEAGAGFKFSFEGSGERNDQQVGGGVEGDGNDAEDGELKKDVAALRSDKLRDEGKEEESGFGIEGFGEDALAEGAALWRGSFRGEIGVAGANHFDAEENQVGGAGVFDGVESYGGSGEDGGDAEGGGEDVEESAKEGAEGRLETFAAAASQGAGEYIEDAGAGSGREKEGGGEEEQEAVRVEHR